MPVSAPDVNVHAKATDASKLCTGFGNIMNPFKYLLTVRNNDTVFDDSNMLPLPVIITTCTS
jgi:hypothetical protein